MSDRRGNDKRHTVADICAAFETLAPIGLAQSWDNVGLLAGDMTVPVRRVLLCIDLTEAVVDEAIRVKAAFVLAYHPPIFKPITSLCVPGNGAEAAVFRCIRHGIAVYAVHTALDAADGGTNDVLAKLCGAQHTEPLEYVDEPGRDERKVVVFVPAEQTEQVADAMFTAGAGHIGDYSRGSYRTTGQGTFYGSEGTSPAVGERGKMEYVEEVRLESIVPAGVLSAVVRAMIAAHPYEEPAFDIYPLEPKPVRGIGRCGKLPAGTTLGGLAAKLKAAAPAPCVLIVGPADRILERAIIVAGAAGSLPFRKSLSSHDVVVTGEIRHHDALTIRRFDATAIALSHWASERPALATLRDRLTEALPDLNTAVSEADCDPLGMVNAEW